MSLSLRAVGYGNRLAPVATVTPTAKANRVRYERAGLIEWYANGPLGLEQGFTIPRRLAGSRYGPLTLSMAMSTRARPTVAAGGHAVSFTQAGGATLRYGGLVVTDARRRVLRSWLVVHARRLLIRIDARGATYPLRIDPLIQQGSKLVGSGATGQFGEGVSLSADGNTALIGSGEDGGDVGAAWVFVRSGGVWVQQGPKLTGSGEIGKGIFGRNPVLSADGNTALIGATFDNTRKGAAWVFVRSGATWVQQGPKLTGGGESGEGYFGRGLALSADGNTALIGGVGDHASEGAAWVFARSGSTWSQQGAKLTPAEPGEGGAGFGSSVALSWDGNTALIAGDNYNSFTGAAWVFVRSGSMWSQQGTRLTGGEEIGQAGFAHRIALSAEGNTAVVGGPADNGGIGAAWVFGRTGSTWSQQGPKLTGSEEVGKGAFGGAVGVSEEGTVLVAGEKDNGSRGAAWVFARSGSGWNQQGPKLTGSGEVGEAQFGYGAAISQDGNTAVLTGPWDNGGVGAAWVFTRAGGTTWDQDGPKLTGGGEGGNAYFGGASPIEAAEHVALSQDGRTMVTGGRLDFVLGAAWVFAKLEPPVIYNSAASAVTTVTATLTGDVGLERWGVSDCHFEYGTSPSYGTNVPCSGLDGLTANGGEVTAPISGLAPNTRYHFRLIVTTNGGTSAGSDQVFTTVPVPPTAVTWEPSFVSGGTATFNGLVSVPADAVSATSCQFEYGTDESYGSSVPCKAFEGTNVEAAAELPSLPVGVTYHYRLAVGSSAGTAYGNDETVRAPAATTFAWRPSTDLSAEDKVSENPRIAVDASGDTVAVWERRVINNRVVEAAFKPAGGSWGTPVMLYGEHEGATAAQPRVAIDASGRVVVVWQTRINSWIIQARTRETDGTWTATTNLVPDDGTHSAQNPNVAFGAHGEAIAVWESYQEGYSQLLSSRDIEGQPWTAAARVSAPGASVLGMPSIAANRNGEAVAAWAQQSPAGFLTTYAASRAPNGTWQPPVFLSGEHRAEDPAVGLDAAGEAVVVWQGIPTSTFVIQSSTRSPTGAWSTPSNVSRGRQVDRPVIAMSETGHALVAWRQTCGCMYGILVQAATKSNGKIWSFPVSLSGESGPGSEPGTVGPPAVAVNERGDAVAAWEHLLPCCGYTSATQGAVRAAGEAWQKPTTLASEVSGFRLPTVGMSATGRAVAAWSQTAGSASIIQTASFDTGPAPTAQTAAASAVTATSATLNGSVNPNGVAVESCSFEYGETASYGRSAACQPSLGTGTTPSAVTAALTGLAPATAYHFRVVAGNDNGASYGGDVTFTTAAQSQAVVFTSSPPMGAVVGGSYSVAATGGGSANPVTFSIDGSSGAGVCSITDSEVTFTGVGTCVIDANQAGSGSFLAAPQVQQTVVVAALAQSIRFTSVPPATPYVGGTYPVAAEGGGSGNPVVFSIDALSTFEACTVLGNAVSFNGVGTCIVDANQAGTATYEAAAQVSQTLTVAEPPPPPFVVSAGPAIDLTKTSATLTASVVGRGAAEPPCYFEFGVTVAYGEIVPCVYNTAGPDEVRAALYALSPGGTYHFRVVVGAANTRVYGSDGLVELQTRAATTLSIEQPPLVGASRESSFGVPVAISADGLTALVSSSYSEGGPPEAVHVLTHTLAGWEQQAEFQPPAGIVRQPWHARFGSSVALSADGDTAIVGAEMDGAGSAEGSAWVYTRFGGVWTTEPTKLRGSRAGGTARFGASVAISADGRHAIVGAPVSGEEAGAAFSFANNANGWSQAGGPIVAAGEQGHAWFGAAVALSASGERLLVGGPSDNGNRGAVWAYTRSGESWSQDGNKLVGSAELGNGVFGNALAISADGSTAVIAAPWDQRSPSPGVVFTFHQAGAQWTESAPELLAQPEPGQPNATFFGWSLGLSADGQTLLVGSLDDNGVVGNVGSARVYNAVEGQWRQQGSRITGAGQVEQSNFGAALALSADGGTALIGGPSDSSWRGAVWGFEVPQVAPSVETGASSEPGPHTSTVQGVVTPNGRSVNECAFEYGTSEAYGTRQACQGQLGGGIEPVNAAAHIAGLLPESTYHYRLAATNSAGTTYGADATFTTTSTGAPAVPQEVSAVAGKGEATVAWAQSGETAGVTYTVTAADITNGSRGGQVANSAGSPAVVLGLTPGDTYTFTVVAANVHGASGPSQASNPVSVEALPPVAPSATTDPATGVGATGATLAATVNPNGSAVTECRFDFGPSAAYGQSVPCSAAVGTGTIPVSVSASVSGLSGTASYHFRIVVTNSGGAAYGSDETLTTTSGAATVVTGLAAEVQPHSAAVGGTVNPNGSLITSCYFEYGIQPPFTQTVPCTTAPGGGSTVVAVSAALTGLRSRTNYQYRLVAANAFGATNGTTSTFSTPPTGEFEPPAAVEATPGVESATVSWQAPYETGGSPVMTYTVTATDQTKPGNGGQTATALGTTAIVTGLHGGDTYTFAVVATNMTETASPASESSNAILIEQTPTITSPSTASLGMRTPVYIAVTTTGTPTPAITVSGSLPTGIIFTDNEDGTGTFSGAALTGTASTYPLTITATNETGQTATQHFVLTITTAVSPPSITSEREDEEALRLPFSLLVTTNGYPAPALSKSGALPAGVTFVNNGNGTATMAGTPTTFGKFTINLTAKSSAGTATKTLIIQVTAAPVFSKIPTTKATVGIPLTLKLKAKGYLPPVLSVPSTGAGALPSGLELTNQSEGIATISGYPAPHSGGLYKPTVFASNVSGEASETFTLEIREAPVVTSAPSVSTAAGTSLAMHFTASGFPAPSISRAGALPRGVVYVGATHELTGVPRLGTQGIYPMTVTAKNAAGSVTQQFVLTVG